MSAMEEKLQRPETPSSTKARCWYFKDLWYKKPKIEVGKEDRPEIVHVRSMDSMFVWKVVEYNRKNRDFLMELVGEQLAIPQAGPAKE